MRISGWSSDVCSSDLAAHAQTISVPGEAVAADLVRDLAREMLTARDQLHHIDRRIEGTLDRHPDAALIRSLPGMGATLTAEFLAITGGIARRSEERRVGKEGVRTCRSRWSPAH